MTVAGELNFGQGGGPDTSATGYGFGFAGFDERGNDGAGGDFLMGQGADGPDDPLRDLDFEVGLDGPLSNTAARGGGDDFFDLPAHGNPDASRDRSGTPAIAVGERGQKEDVGGTAASAGPPTPPESNGQASEAEREGREGREVLGKPKSGAANNKGIAGTTKKKPVQPVRDKVTTLLSDDITKSRDGYTETMKKSLLEKDLERFGKGQKELVREMIVCPMRGGGSALHACHGML